MSVTDDYSSLKMSLKSSEVHPSVLSLPKRWLDVAGSLVGLVVLAIAFFPIAGAIKLTSPGPIFYQQVRCGLQGQCFTLYKFRTMVDNADKLQGLVQNEAQGAIFKNRHDPRVTWIGKFLRKTSLDELPQFWNVLRGEMSLVGTRPPTVNEVAQYNERHFLRLRVKPGLTGVWQANGRSSIEDFEKIVDLDLKYQSHWSLGYDLHLILKTIFVLFFQVGAY